ncbi:hypothetical protein BTN45_26705 (plasmid) [Rhizobium sp. ZX09]|nr:hypothetical protein BTN45_26705 [Rhizobium sp. ZX09]
MLVSFSGFPPGTRSGPLPLRPSGAVPKSRRNDGCFRVRGGHDEQHRLAAKRGSALRGTRAGDERQAVPAAARRDSGLEANGRRIRPQHNRWAERQGDETVIGNAGADPT